MAVHNYKCIGTGGFLLDCNIIDKFVMILRIISRGGHLDDKQSRNREIHYLDILECTFSYVKFMTIVVCYALICM